jgi:hypothetical protein
MERSREPAYRLPPDDQGPFVDLDRIRIDMLNEPPPEPAETVFAGVRSFGGRVLDRLRFFRWVLHELYDGDITRWEGSLERRDERLRAVRGRCHAASGHDVRVAS